MKLDWIGHVLDPARGSASRGRPSLSALPRWTKVMPILPALALMIGGTRPAAAYSVGTAEPAELQALARLGRADAASGCVLRFRHLGLRPREIAVVARCRERREPGEPVAEQLVRHDVLGDRAGLCAAPGVTKRRPVHHPAHRPADVDIVERRLRHVERDVVEPVCGVDAGARPRLRGVLRVARRSPSATRSGRRPRARPPRSFLTISTALARPTDEDEPVGVVLPRRARCPCAGRSLGCGRA